MKKRVCKNCERLKKLLRRAYRRISADNRDRVAGIGYGQFLK